MAHVLVVDDDAHHRAAVRTILELEGHCVETAPDGEAALVRLSAGDAPAVDLVVLDLMMQWVDGWEFLRRAGDGLPPVVVLTSRDDPYAEQRIARTRTIAQCLLKPVDADELVSCVAALTAAVVPPDAPPTAGG